MREVILKVTSQKDLIKHKSDAKTFGELKKELPNVKWSGMRVVERSKKTTLQMNDAVLPTGDFILFLVPERVKSGTKKEGGLEKLPKPIDECSYNELRSHMSWLNREKDAGLNVSGSTDDLRKALKKYLKKAEKNGGKKKPKKETIKAKVKSKKEEKVEEAKEEGISSTSKATGMTDLALTIEDARGKINLAIDSIIENAALIEQGAVAEVEPPLEYTIEDLEKEIEVIRKALKTPAYTKVE